MSNKTRGQSYLTKSRIAVCMNRANIYNEKTFYLNGVRIYSTGASLVPWLCDIIAICLLAAICAVRLFKLLFRANANV